jgi:hypothetical protein
LLSDLPAADWLPKTLPSGSYVVGQGFHFPLPATAGKIFPIFNFPLSGMPISQKNPHLYFLGSFPAYSF